MKKDQNIFLIIIISLIIITFMSCRSKETAKILHDDSLALEQDSAGIQSISGNFTMDTITRYTDTIKQNVFAGETVVHDTIIKIIVLKAPTIQTGPSMPDCPAPGLCKIDTLGGYIEHRTRLGTGD